MNCARNLTIIIWCFLCGLLFFMGMDSFIFLHGKKIPYFFIIGLAMYVIGIPPIYFLDKSDENSIIKYNILKIASLFALYLTVQMGVVGIFPSAFNILIPFFIFYLSMGFWVLLSVWFFIVSMKYRNISHVGKIYALISLIIINGGCLLFSIIYDYVGMTKY